MGASQTVKGTAIVGVIASAADLRADSKSSDSPDLFELRLDALIHQLDEAERFARRTRVPLIITARHPLEGGFHALNATARRELITRFSRYAHYIDIELRSVNSMRRVIDRVDRLIVSVHDFHKTPPVTRMMAKLKVARGANANVFKIATRTETPVALSRLLQFVSTTTKEPPIVAMGIGKYGTLSRLLFARCGSPFVYAAMSAAVVEGQPTVKQLRSLLSSV